MPMIRSFSHMCNTAGGSTYLKLRFPNLYTHVTDQWISAADCYADGVWVINIDHTTTRQVQAELALLCSELRNVTPQLGTRDAITWNRHATGKFITASAYKFITNTPHVRVSTGNIWKIGAPPRVTIFIWLMLNNRILTIDNLMRRRFQMTNICSLCWKDNETVQHLFFSCIYSTNVRSYVQAAVAGSSMPGITHPSRDSLLSRDQDRHTNS
jgi:zinc-binding in reverse transcriptase